MTPQEDITISRGLDFYYALAISNTDNDTDFDLTGYTASAKVRPEPDSSLVLATFTCTILTTNGGPIILTLGETVTSALPIGVFHYDLVITHPSLPDWKLLAGKATVEPVASWNDANEVPPRRRGNRPSPPSNLIIVSVASDNVVLAWDESSSDGLSFQIQRRTETGSYIHIGSSDADTYTDSAVAENTDYFYRVRAVGPHNNSAFSNEVSTTTLVSAPAAPSDLTITALLTNEVHLAWTDNSDNETGFVVQRKEGLAGTYADIARTGTDVNFYGDDDSALEDGTLYYYRVRATNTGGDSAYSNEASGTTALLPPTSVIATAVSTTQINLTWIDNSVSETGYKIERKTGAGGTYAQIDLVSADVESYSDTSLSPDTTYYYRLRTTNGVIDSDYSTEAFATTLEAAPTGKIVHGNFHLLKSHAYVLDSTSTLNRAEVRGYRHRLGWSDLAPSDTFNNFQPLIDSIERARAHDKVVGIGVAAGTACPDWLESKGAVFNTVTIKGVQYRMPWPFDPVFRSYWSTFVHALGAQFESDPNVVYVVMGGYGNNFGCDVVQTEEDIAAFIAAGGLPAWDIAAKANTAAWMDAFPTTPAIMQLNPPIPNNDGQNELASISDWLAANYPQHGGFMYEAWKATSGAQQVFQIITQYSPTNPTGLQQIHAAAANHTPPEQEDFGDLAAGIANLVNLGAPHYTEDYPSDFTDANAPLWEEADGILRSGF